jgi:hypothetical protein
MGIITIALTLDFNLPISLNFLQRKKNVGKGISVGIPTFVSLQLSLSSFQ